MGNAQSHELLLVGGCQLGQDVVKAGERAVDAVGFEGVPIAGLEFLAEVLSLDDEALLVGLEVGNAFAEFLSEEFGAAGGEGVDAVAELGIYGGEFLGVAGLVALEAGAVGGGVGLGGFGGGLDDVGVTDEVADLADDGVFEGIRLDAADAAGGVGLLFVGVAAGIVAVDAAGGIAGAGGVGDHGAFAASAEDETLEEVMVLVAGLEAGDRDGAFGDGGGSAFKEVLGDEGGMLAGVCFAVEADDAGVDGIADDLPENVAAEATAADLLGGAVAAFEDALTGAEALGVEGVGEIGERDEFGGGLEDAADGERVGWVWVEGLSLLVVVVTVGDLAGVPEAALRLLEHLDADFVGGVVALVLGEVRPKVVVKALRGGFIGEVLGGTFEAAVVFPEKGAERNPVVSAAEHSLEFEDEDDLGCAGFDVAHEGLHAGAAEGAARIGRVGEDAADIPAFRGMLLHVLAAEGFLTFAGIKSSADLIKGRDAGVDCDGNKSQRGRLSWDRFH